MLVFATEKGANLKVNKWKSGDSLEIAEATAKILIAKGFVTTEKKVKKTTKKDSEE